MMVVGDGGKGECSHSSFRKLEYISASVSVGMATGELYG